MYFSLKSIPREEALPLSLRDEPYVFESVEHREGKKLQSLCCIRLPIDADGSLWVKMASYERRSLLIDADGSLWVQMALNGYRCVSMDVPKWIVIVIY